VCVYERECVREPCSAISVIFRLFSLTCVGVCEREREREEECVCVRERECEKAVQRVLNFLYVSLKCVCERERERESECVCV